MEDLFTKILIGVEHMEKIQFCSVRCAVCDVPFLDRSLQFDRITVRRSFVAVDARIGVRNFRIKT